MMADRAQAATCGFGSPHTMTPLGGWRSEEEDVSKPVARIDVVEWPRLAAWSLWRVALDSSGSVLGTCAGQVLATH
jgi:hypothetical protein